MKITLSALIFSFVLLTNCKTNKTILPEKDSLQIEKLSKNTYIHTSYLQTESFGNVPCNGLIIVNNGEAIVIDTPTEVEVSNELILYIENELHATIKYVVPTHFHNDCLGGLEAFHQRNIPSITHEKTITLAKQSGSNIPQEGFSNQRELQVGKGTVELFFPGEGHTKDNITAYYAQDEVLFGGCLVKTMNASKGYLGDANVEDWPTSIRQVKTKYPNLKKVVPGHGDSGGMELLDYTMKLFSAKD